MTTQDTIEKLSRAARFLEKGIEVFRKKGRLQETEIMAAMKEAVSQTRWYMDQGCSLPAALHASHHIQYYGSTIERAMSQLTYALAGALVGMNPEDPNPWKVK